jgi:hypothetical protein
MDKRLHEEHGIVADHQPASPLFSITDWIIDYESGNLGEQEIVEGFQRLIDTGMVWHLQGSYVRTARELIRLGLVTIPQH